MTSKRTLCRRRFLQGLGAAGLALPLMSSLRARGADGFPKRLVVFFVSDGVLWDRWRPSGGETGMTLGPLMAPLERHKDKLLILDGINIQVAERGAGDGHQRAMAGMLTGRRTIGDGSSTPVIGGGISVDQLIAGRIGGETRFPSLEFGVQCRNSSVWRRMCYSGPATPVAPMQNPFDAYSRIFSGLTVPDTAAADALISQRRSVLDHVQGELARLEGEVDRADREKLGNHLALVRDLETRLETGAGASASCEELDMGSRFDAGANQNYPTVGQLDMDMIAMSFACDLTRVASIQWTASNSETTFPWLGVNEEHHAVSHSGRGSSRTDKLDRIYGWYVEQFAYLLDRLAAIPEGDGTVLDNTVVLWTSDFSDGHDHIWRRIPFMLAGSAGGYFRTGRYLTFDDLPHNDLLVSLCHAMGVEVSTFGDERYCSGGPISSLT